MKSGLKLGLALAAMSVAPMQAHAQLTLQGQSNASGGGLGAVQTVLVLQNQGSATVESGCIAPNGTGSCGYTDAAVQSGISTVRAVSLFPGLTGSNFRLFLNAAEPGNDNQITVNNLQVRLYNAAGVQVFQSTAFATPLDLTNTLPGTGNYGFVFGLSTGDQALFNAALAANPGGTIGVGASLSNVAGGQESFSIGTAGGTTNPTVVPEPSTYLLMASGLVGLGLYHRRRRNA